jgi:hypothetical protein
VGNHFSAIGIRSRDELSNLIDQALESPSKKYSDSEKGQTYLLTDNVVELWIHLATKDCVPAFVSSIKLQAKSRYWIEADNNNPYEAMLRLDVLNEKSQLQYPLAVTFGNVRAVRRAIILESEVQFSVTAFIEKMKKWESSEIYKLENPNSKVGPGWFFPLGPFAALEKLRQNKAKAAFYGKVIHIETKINTWTGHQYKYLRLECGKITYEAVTDVTDIAIGNFVYVECWLCGRYEGALTTKS